jgi:hypothetical protein
MVPIWLDLVAADVSKYSPMLADRVALRADQGIPAITSAIRDLLAKAKLGRANRKVYLYRVGLTAVGAGRDSIGKLCEVVSQLPPEWLSQHGYAIPKIPGVAVLGVLPKLLDENGEFVPDNFRENLTFVEFLHDLLAQHIFEDPGLQQKAKEQSKGYLGLRDGRKGGGQEAVPPEDIIGWVDVEGGKALAGSYRRNPEHELLTADGFFLLPEGLEWLLDHELRSKCLDTKARQSLLRLKSQL